MMIIFIEGKLKVPTKINLCNNVGLSYLFDQVRLEINGVEVDGTCLLGTASS